MIFLRPILSESQPNKTNNGIPSSNALATIIFESRGGTFNIVVIKNKAKNCPVYQTTPWPAVAPNNEIRNSLKFGHCVKASFRGAVEVIPADLICWKIGDSFICSRIYREISTRNRDARNGMRQPQSLKATSLMEFCVPRITAMETNKPSVAVI